MDSSRPKSSVAQIIQATCSLLLVAAAIFGYFYSVQPIATKARLEERNAELEASIRISEQKLGAITEEAYRYVVRQYLNRVLILAKTCSLASSAEYNKYEVAKSLAALDEHFLGIPNNFSNNVQLALKKAAEACPFTPKDLLINHLQDPEFKLLTPDQNWKFSKALREFIDQKRHSSALYDRLHFQLSIPAGGVVEFVDSGRAGEMSKIEENRIASLHDAFASALQDLKSVLLN